jgi:hypothetical protein
MSARAVLAARSRTTTPLLGAGVGEMQCSAAQRSGGALDTAAAGWGGQLTYSLMRDAR